MIIEVKNLFKTYKSPTGDVQAVNDISFSVQEGSLFSFLGTNGAGKSTTINILTTLLGKTSGKAAVGGYEVDKNPNNVRELIGIVYQDSVLDERLSVKENLESRAALYGYRGAKLKSAVDRVIKTTHLEDISKRYYGKLSGGQRRRTDIARALIHTPKLLFLDEPTTGLDPKTRKDIWELIQNLQKETGMTVFLTTHYMEEAKESDNVIVINKGKIQAQGTPEQLKEAYAKDILKMVLKNGERIEKTLESSKEALPYVDKHRNEIEHIEIISGTLDDVFLNLTGMAEEGGM